MDFESKSMMQMCLKKVKGLNKVKLVDANFIWTEPHSRRIKIKITIQKEAVVNTTLQTTFIVTFTINNEQCADCRKTYTPHLWTAAV
jgi:nonsense-mediated mRNA decay protein 3